MRSETDVRRVFELCDQGRSKKAIARETGVSRSQVRMWLARSLDSVLASPMRLAGDASGPCDRRCDLPSSVEPGRYAYLLGQYLGDGCISEGRRHVFRLRITTCDDYPNIRAECEEAIRAVMPGRTVGRVQREGCTEVYCDSKHWPCLFPQHGPGRKHTRPIMLRRWQERIAFDLCPDQLLRGLIHSDGCRSLNRVKRPTKAGIKEYVYPRYFFTNESGHIRGIFLEACRRIGIEYHYNMPTSISIARRRSVAMLDTFVGPKS